ALAAPIPLAPPVTSALRPFSVFSITQPSVSKIQCGGWLQRGWSRPKLKRPNYSINPVTQAAQ
ncbi:MAG: hypothetical protein ACHQ7M_19500, partial [Chloroflexota bacterium]